MTDQGVTVTQPVPFSHRTPCRRPRHRLPILPQRRRELDGRGRAANRNLHDTAIRRYGPTPRCSSPSARASPRANRSIGSQVNRLPDYVYFDHSVHIAKGVGCTTCHGEVEHMPLMRQAVAADDAMVPRLPSRSRAQSSRARRRLRDGLGAAERSGRARQTSDGEISYPCRQPDRLLRVSPMSDETKLSRRNALKLLAGQMALLVAGCSKPREEIVPYVRMPERLVPGVPLQFATTLDLGGYGRGVICTSIEGRPIKIEGNPLHPASLGATDAFAEAAIFSLYDPDRSQTVRQSGRDQQLGGVSRRPATASRATRRRGRRGTADSDRARHLAHFDAADQVAASAVSRLRMASARSA